MDKKELSGEYREVYAVKTDNPTLAGYLVVETREHVIRLEVPSGASEASLRSLKAAGMILSEYKFGKEEFKELSPADTESDREKEQSSSVDWIESADLGDVDDVTVVDPSEVSDLFEDD